MKIVLDITPPPPLSKMNMDTGVPEKIKNDKRIVLETWSTKTKII